MTKTHLCFFIQEFIEDIKKSKQTIFKQHTKKASDFIPLDSSVPSVLDRFKPKSTKKK